MCGYSDNVWNSNKFFWSDPIGNLSILKDYAVQETKKTWDNGVQAVQAHMRGDINLFDIGAEYCKEGLLNTASGIGDAFKSVGIGLWQLSPFSTISDEDVYKLGYNLEGAALSASEAVVTAYVGAKAPGMAKSVANKVSPKLKKITSSIYSKNTASNNLVGLYRKNSNIGDLKELEELMQLKYVKNVAKDAGVKLKGVKIKIVRDNELIGKGLYGFIHKNHITLYPDAFTNIENLVKTIGHERVHVSQYISKGKPLTTEIAMQFEKEAYASEEIWWSNYKLKKGMK